MSKCHLKSPQFTLQCSVSKHDLPYTKETVGSCI